MSATPRRVAVIRWGISSVHLAVLDRMPDGQLASVCDEHEGRRVAAESASGLAVAAL